MGAFHSHTTMSLNIYLTAHPAAPDGAWWQAGDGLAVEQHRAVVGRKLSAHHVERGALARAVGADERQQLTCLQAERDVLHGFHAAKGFADVPDLQQAHGRASALFFRAIRAHSACA